LVYVGVENEKELNKWIEKLEWRNMEWTGFREPDLDNQLTALACLHDGNVFSSLKLYGE
jgi:hypothetical protein